MPDNYNIIKEIRRIISKAGINNTPEVVDIVEKTLKKINSGERLELAALTTIKSHVRGCSR